MSKQIFPIIDPETGKQIGKKPRYKVHLEGDWHWGLQVNIIRFKDKKNPEMLVQERSELVDISSHKLDQSLATQMLSSDHGNQITALTRGLKQELGITLRKDIKQVVKIGDLGSFKIIKTYFSNPDLYNRELTSLFILVTTKNNIKPHSPRVRKVDWIPFEDLKGLIALNPNKFTKTARFYFTNKELYKLIEKTIFNLPEKTDKIRKLPFKSHYYSYGYNDIIINDYLDGHSSINVNNCQNSIKLIKEIKNIKEYNIRAERDRIQITGHKLNLNYLSKIK